MRFEYSSNSKHFIVEITTVHHTPVINADGFIVFVFPFIHSYFRSFLIPSLTEVSGSCVIVSEVMYI